MNSGRIIPTAEPFFFLGASSSTPVGCLLVHGFTGAPKEMRWLGEYLAERGYAVLGVRLAGHATQPQDLLRVCWEDWLTDVEDGWQLLSGVSQRIYLAGLSMGGMLSLLFASRFPVAGVVAMSTLHHLPKDWRLPYAEMFSLIQPSIAKGASDWRDEEAEQSHVDYPSYPTRAIAELRDLLEEMRCSLGKVTAPVLLINSKDDHTVRLEEHHAEQILQALGSQDKSILWIEGSGHVITRDAQRARVFQATYDFIRRIEENLEP
jgi:carboxylesterase